MVVAKLGVFQTSYVAVRLLRKQQLELLTDMT